MMRDCFVIALWSRLPAAPRRTGRIGLGLATLWIAMLSAGCAPAVDERVLIPIAPDWDSFDREVLKSPMPVLVEFGKDPCPPCVSQKKELAPLAEEFRGQVKFTTFLLVQGEFHVNCPKIRDQYQLHWMPTTILIVNGKERMRWEECHKAAEIREGIKQALLETSSSP
jgi:thioredoxin 1